MKKLYFFFILISLSVLLVSCSKETEKVESPDDSIIQNPLIFKHNNQEFKIFTYYEEFEDFLESAKKQPHNIEELYKQTVVKSFRDDTGFPIVTHSMLTVPKDIEAMEELVGKLIDKQTLINDWIMDALKDSVDRLPGGNKSIYVLPSTPEYKSDIKVMNYINGHAWSQNMFVIMIDPSFLEEHLKYTIAHEYNHVVAMENNEAYTMLEGTILEGKADTFAKTIYPKVNIHWITPLTGYYAEEGWKFFEENLYLTDSDLWIDFSFGNLSKGIAPWSNYKIGYEIMENFLEENPDVSIEEWTKMSAKDILLKSKYKED